MEVGQDRVDALPGLRLNWRGNVDVIVTGGTSAAKALKAATRTIPIVMAIVSDPVAAGLVDNLARPGGNATGFSIVAPELGTKRLELLKEIAPTVSSIAVLLNTNNPQSKVELKEMQTAAQAMGLQLHPVEISTEDGLSDAFAAMNKVGVAGLIVLTDPILFSQRKLTLIWRTRMGFLPYFFKDCRRGSLISYGPSDADLYRRAAGYVDRILKGAKPGGLPCSSSPEVRPVCQPQDRRDAWRRNSRIVPHSRR
jgi:putative ABC transport system substrate-binding protein